MRLLLIIIVIILCSVSCNDLEITNPQHPDFVPELSIDKSEYKVDGFSGSFTINITSNIAWKVSLSDDPWLNYNPTKGSGNGFITINYTENTDTSKRNATITVSGGELSKNCTVIQEELLSIIFIKGGTFQMGSTDGNSDEQPIHSVIISDYYMSKHEVTQKLYQEVMKMNPSYFNGNDLPVESVTWYGALEFCNGLSRKYSLTPAYTISGTSVTWNQNANGYRLPTEAEWEYAAGGGSSNRTKWAGTSTEGYLGNYAWYDSAFEGKTHPVGTKQPNTLGLYDLSGNVWEWCWDWYGSSYYSSSSTNDPIGPSSGSVHVVRGGCWSSFAEYCRVADRNFINPSSRYSVMGFRLVRNAP